MIKQEQSQVRESRRLFTREELSKLLKVSTRMVSRMLSAGQLPAPVRLGRLPRWREEDIDKFLFDSIDEAHK